MFLSVWHICCFHCQPGNSFIKLSNSIQNVSIYIYNVTRISDLNVENSSTAFDYIGHIGIFIFILFFNELKCI